MPHVELPQAEFKVVVLGDTNTGKTSLVIRFVEGFYRAESRSPTVGAFFLTKRLTVDSITCKMLLWDTAGQEQFQRLAQTYYASAAAAILTYDVSSPQSLVKLRHWLAEVSRHIATQRNRRMVVCICACKGDLDAATDDLEAEARQLADQHGALYGTTSAKDGRGVTEVFSATAKRVLQWQSEAATGTGPAIPVTVGAGSRRPSPRKAAQQQQQQKQSPLHSESNAAVAVSSSTYASQQQQQQQQPQQPQSRNQQSSLLQQPSLKSPGASSSLMEVTPLSDSSETADETVVEDDVPATSTSCNPIPPAHVLCEGSLLACGTDDRNCCVM